MPPVKVGNSLLTDLSNAIAGLRRGKQKEDDMNTARANNERMVELREEENRRQNESLGLDRLRGERESEQLAMQRTRAEQDEAERQREISEREGAEPGLRERILQIDPKAQGLDKMDYASLRAQLGLLETRRTQREVTILAHRQQLDDQLRAIRQLSAMANMDLANIKRARDDAIKRVMSDPALMKQYNELVKAKDPEPMRKMIAQISNGRDLDAEYLRAGQEVTRLKNQAMTMVGITGGAGPMPEVQRAVDKNMPFALLDPTAQAQIAAEITTRLKSGGQIDISEARSRGIPVESIAANAGVTIDPVTGLVQPTATPSPSAPGQPAQPITPNWRFPTVPGPQPETGGEFAERLHSSMEAAFTPGPLVQPPATLALLRQRMGVPEGGVIPPRPTPVAGDETALRHGFKQLGQPKGLTISSRFGISPTPGMQGGPPLPLQQPGPYTKLSGATTMPMAEQEARLLLDAGHAYEQVVGNIPETFRSMLQARLPKRLPTGGTQPY